MYELLRARKKAGPCTTLSSDNIILLKDVFKGESDGDEGEDEWTEGLLFDETSLQLSENTGIGDQSRSFNNRAAPLPSPSDVETGLQEPSTGEVWSFGARNTLPAKPV